MDLDGKVALVTGGSNGIGEGVARHLAAQGARVVIADIDDANGGRVADEIAGRFIHADVSDPAASAAAVAHAVAEFGGLHLAHLNAGATSWCGMGDDFDPEPYRRSMALNLDGVVYGIAAARSAIVTSGGGTIVATGLHGRARRGPVRSHLRRRTNTPLSDWFARSARATPPRAFASTLCARRSPPRTSSRVLSRP